MKFQLHFDGTIVDAFVVSHPGHFGANVNSKGGYNRVEEDWRRMASNIKVLFQ